MSMPKSGLPVTIFALSTPGIDLPMILKSFGFLSVTVLSAGAVSVAALAASSPYVALRRDARWCTTPASVVHSPAGTFQLAAAAATSICRPAAPARRSGSQLVGVDVLPPAT
jgi:hypothetical protein